MRLPAIKEKFAITNKSVFSVYDILMGFSAVGQKKMHKAHVRTAAIPELSLTIWEFKTLYAFLAL